MGGWKPCGEWEMEMIPDSSSLFSCAIIAVEWIPRQHALIVALDRIVDPLFCAFTRKLFPLRSLPLALYLATNRARRFVD